MPISQLALYSHYITLQSTPVQYTIILHHCLLCGVTLINVYWITAHFFARQTKTKQPIQQQRKSVLNLTQIQQQNKPGNHMRGYPPVPFHTFSLRGWIRALLLPARIHPGSPAADLGVPPVSAYPEPGRTAKSHAPCSSSNSHGSGKSYPLESDWGNGLRACGNIQSLLGAWSFHCRLQRSGTPISSSRLRCWYPASCQIPPISHSFHAQ